MEPADNPFSSRFVRPGAIPYQFADGGELDTIHQRWKTLGSTVQILGAHGAGKSTLLASLRPHFEADRLTLQAFVVSNPATDSAAMWAARGWNSQSVIVVDGYERLPIWSRWRLAWKRWRSGARLILTTHADLGFPMLCELKPMPEDVVRLARHLQRQHPPLVTDEDAAEAFEHHPGNVREALFELFDVYEKRARETAAPQEGQVL